MTRVKPTSRMASENPSRCPDRVEISAVAFSWQENGGALASELEAASKKLCDRIGTTDESHSSKTSIKLFKIPSWADGRSYSGRWAVLCRRNSTGRRRGDVHRPSPRTSRRQVTPVDPCPPSALEMTSPKLLWECILAADVGLAGASATRKPPQPPRTTTRCPLYQWVCLGLGGTASLLRLHPKILEV